MKRNHWERFLDSLDTAGGHVALLIFLIGVGILMAIAAVPKGEDIIVGSFGALLGALKQVHSNLTRIKDEDSAGTVETKVTATKVTESTTEKE